MFFNERIDSTTSLFNYFMSILYLILFFLIAYAGKLLIYVLAKLKYE